MDAESQIERIQLALQRRFRIAGRGSVGRVQELLDLGPSYFKNQRRAGQRRIDLKVLFSTLALLDAEVDEFFVSTLGPVDPVNVFRAEARSLRRGARQSPSILLLEAKRVAGEAREEADLGALDALRHKAPRRVMRQARKLIPHIADHQLAELLGIYASACRLLGKPEEAQIILARALEIAVAGEDPEALATLLQRASYTLKSRGQGEEALALSRRATLAYVRLGDLVGIGKTLVDRGIWLGAMGRAEEQKATLESALSYLPAEDEHPDVRRHRFACLLNLGIACRQLQHLDDARRYTTLAARLVADVEPGLLGKLWWLRASIARQAGDYREAVRFYRRTFEILRPLKPADAALSALELVRLHLDHGRISEAYRTAKALTVLVTPLKRNLAASDALTELLRCTLTGRGLTPAFLKRIAQGLEQGR